MPSLTAARRDDTPPPPLRAIVLAAGRGTRLGALTADCPKCLIPVNGVPILRNALLRLASIGIEETTIVVGHLAEQVRQSVGRAVGTMRISFCDNRRFAETGTAQSLLLAAGDEQADVLVLEGDVFFDAAVLHGLLTAAYVDVTAVERWRPWHSGTSVTRRDDGTVDRWMHEKERPVGLRIAQTFKTTNLHRFSREFMTNWLVPALKAQVARNEEAPLESVFAAIVSRGASVHAVDVEGRWVEIDDIEDLQRAQALFAPQQEQVTL